MFSMCRTRRVLYLLKYSTRTTLPAISNIHNGLHDVIVVQEQAEVEKRRNAFLERQKKV